MSAQPRLLVFQHVDVEHPGVFREFLEADGIPWDVVELDQGECIPDLALYAGLWVMGGPMDVWELSAHSWLAAEKTAIRHAVVDLKLPYLGICLGHQLLAASLDGEVAKGTPEVGVMPIDLNDDGRQSGFFEGLPSRLNCLQWHGAEVKTMPPLARVLASSNACAIQSMAIEDYALSAQFHVEITAATVPEWSEIPEYANALEAAIGSDALENFKHDVTHSMPEFNHQAKRLYDNWMRTTGFPINSTASIESVS